MDVLFPWRKKPAPNQPQGGRRAPPNRADVQSVGSSRRRPFQRGGEDEDDPHSGSFNMRGGQDGGNQLYDSQQYSDYDPNGANTMDDETTGTWGRSHSGSGFDSGRRSVDEDGTYHTATGEDGTIATSGGGTFVTAGDASGTYDGQEGDGTYVTANGTYVPNGAPPPSSLRGGRTGRRRGQQSGGGGVKDSFKTQSTNASNPSMGGESLPNSRAESYHPSDSYRREDSNRDNSAYSSARGEDLYYDETGANYMEEEAPVNPIRQLLDAINMSILPSSLRLSVLAQAVEFFDHRDRSVHDSELREGASFVLYHKLALALRLASCTEWEAAYDAAQASGMIAGGPGSSGTPTAAGMGGMNANMMMLLGLGGAGANGIPKGVPSQSLTYSIMMRNNPLGANGGAASTQAQLDFDKELAMICSCLEMVHRSNPDAIAAAWDECGVEILPLLVSVLERPFAKIERAVWRAVREKANVPGSLERATATAVNRDQKLAVQKVTKVLAMYSLVPEAKAPMCECEGMLRMLTRIIDTHNYNRVKPGAPAIGGTASAAAAAAAMGLSGSAAAAAGLGGIGADAVQPGDDAEAITRKEAAARLALAQRATSGSGLYMTEAARFNTIAALTNLAALEPNRMRMLAEPGLIENVCRAVHNERSDVPKQCSALAIMNLSNGDPEHVPEMASNDLVLETLLKLMREDNPETRRNAVVTIFNIACSDQNTVKLARYRDGTILEALTELVGNDDPVRIHDEARSNAAETLFNMSCSDIDETTDRMANHAGLLECLAVTLRGEHTGLEVKMYCAATLRRMAELIRQPMIAQGALLSALVKASSWTITDDISEAFRAQAIEPENCLVMAQHHGLLNALSRLALAKGESEDSEKVRMAAVGAIELMSREDEARALLANNEGIVMALTRASYGGDDNSALTGVKSTLLMSEGGDDDGGSIGDGGGGGSYNSRSQYREGGGGTDGSPGGGGDDDEGSEFDDEISMQSKRIQVALKNLVSAM